LTTAVRKLAFLDWLSGREARVVCENQCWSARIPGSGLYRCIAYYGLSATSATARARWAMGRCWLRRTI